MTRASTSQLTGKMYSYNRCFNHTQRNAEVYEESCEEIVLSALNGINGTIFMYGQTGAGKTYTMLGDSEKELKERPTLSRIQN